MIMKFLGPRFGDVADKRFGYGMVVISKEQNPQRTARPETIPSATMSRSWRTRRRRLPGHASGDQRTIGDGEDRAEY